MELSWKDVLDTSKSLSLTYETAGSIAKDMGYKYYVWNGWVRNLKHQNLGTLAELGLAENGAPSVQVYLKDLLKKDEASKFIGALSSMSTMYAVKSLCLVLNSFSLEELPSNLSKILHWISMFGLTNKSEL